MQIAAALTSPKQLSPAGTDVSLIIHFIVIEKKKVTAPPDYVSSNGDNAPSEGGDAADSTDDMIDPYAIDTNAADGSISGVTLCSADATAHYLVKSGKQIHTKAELSAEIKNCEDLLNSCGDDAQLANVDLQNSLQRQQQILQMMSNISKVIYETATNIIRKLAS